MNETGNGKEAIKISAQSKERSAGAASSRGRSIKCGKCGLIVAAEGSPCCTRCGVLLDNWGIAAGRRVLLTKTPPAPKRRPLVSWGGLLVLTAVLLVLLAANRWLFMPNSLSAQPSPASASAPGSNAASATKDLDASGATAALTGAAVGGGVWGATGSETEMIAIRVDAGNDSAAGKYMVRSRQHKMERWSAGTPYQTPDAAIRAMQSGGIQSFGKWSNSRSSE